MKSFLQTLMFWKSRVPRVALVRLTGIIAAGSSPLKRGLNLDSIDPMLKKAFGMRRIKAVILVINSPGGSPVQSALIGARIRQLAKKHDVPVLAFCEDVAASGGYWLATAADEIFANNASIIGSIGVISAGFGFPLKSWVLNGAFTPRVSQNQCWIRFGLKKKKMCSICKRCSLTFTRPSLTRSSLGAEAVWMHLRMSCTAVSSGPG